VYLVRSVSLFETAHEAYERRRDCRFAARRHDPDFTSALTRAQEDADRFSMSEKQQIPVKEWLLQHEQLRGVGPEGLERLWAAGRSSTFDCVNSLLRGQEVGRMSNGGVWVGLLDST
jgi:hypothetical protein